jgi:MFS family permease
MGFLILFWTLFDGILQYAVPLVITGEGISKTMLGIIIGTSSIAGMLFDLFLCKLIKKPNLRRTYLIMFAICIIFPLVLMTAKTAWMYVLAMVIWGLYYDLFNIGRYEFVAQYIKEDEHASSFGVLQVFSSLGYLLSPLFAGFLIAQTLDAKPFIASWVFLGLAFVSFMILIALLIKQKKHPESYVSETLKEINCDCKPKYSEIYIWKRVGTLILPVLLVTLMINVIDAIFCEIGPLVAEGWVSLGILAGLFLVAYLLPFVFVGWFVGSITQRFGKKKTAIYSLLLSSLFLVPFFFVTNPIILIILTFFSGTFLAICDPANRATYADYVSETPDIETDIESQADFATNAGYVIGPIMAGFLADTLGNIPAFAVIGIFGIIVALILLAITPKEINITLDDKKEKDKITKNFIKNKV